MRAQCSYIGIFSYPLVLRRRETGAESTDFEAEKRRFFLFQKAFCGENKQCRHAKLLLFSLKTLTVVA